MTKGSQKWIQICCNAKRSYFEKELARQTNIKPISEWLSPLDEENYKEYRDNEFIKKLKVNPSIELSSFWPGGGPQWDALALSGKTVLLFEAKAHVREAYSSGSRASLKSKNLIYFSLNKIKQYLRVDYEYQWHLTFYQYTNRLAHLYYFSVLNDIPAQLIFVSFLNDEEMNGPKDVEVWETCYKTIEAGLGIPVRNKLRKFIHHVYIDVNQLNQTKKADREKSCFISQRVNILIGINCFDDSEGTRFQRLEILRNELPASLHTAELAPSLSILHHSKSH